jgi:TonB family protein
MKITTTFSSIFIASALLVAGCKTPPAADVNTPQAAVDESAAERARLEADAVKKKADADARKTRAAAARAKAAKAAATPAPVAETVTPPTKIKNVQPVYPAVARSAGVEGSVQLEVSVNENGKVSDARVIRSVPLLDQAALDAVKQWEYTPMRRGSVAVASVMMVTVNFVRS